VASTYQLLVNGAPVEADFYDALSSVEVEENIELPGAILLNFPIARTPEGDLTGVADPRFAAYANIAVVVQVEDKPAHCIFDGYVLSHKIHLDTGTAASSLEVWGQDASWLMNLEEKVREWVDVTESAVAGTIFDEYGITAAPENTVDDSPMHPESGHTLMQRGTDIQFLRQLARRNGRQCRVACADEAGKRIGYFVAPDLGAKAALTLVLNPPDDATVRALDFSWDVARPSEVKARQALFGNPDEDGAIGDTSDSALPLLDERGLATFGMPMKVLLAAPVDEAGELVARAQSVLREASFFVRCTGDVNVAQLKDVLRVGTVVTVEGAGSLHSGSYFVWSVRHSLTIDSHNMSFVLVRNAVGPVPSGDMQG
jgi:phage protein D